MLLSCLERSSASTFGVVLTDHSGASSVAAELLGEGGGGSGDTPKIKLVPIESVRIPNKRLRALSEVEALRESIASGGLLQPLVVDEKLTLLCGMHRLEACRQLGWKQIPVVVRTAVGPRARLAEIDENLCRRELSALERAEHLAQRKYLWEELFAEAPPSSEAADKKKKAKKADAPLEAFLAETEKATGRGKALIRQELKIGELPEPVRDLARETASVSHNKRELLALTRMPEQEQRAALEAVKAGEQKSVRKRPAKTDEDGEGKKKKAKAEPTEEQQDLLPPEPEPVLEPLAEAESEPADPVVDRWREVSAALRRGEYELEQAMASWPVDPTMITELEGDEGHEELRRVLGSVRLLLKVVSARTG